MLHLNLGEDRGRNEDKENDDGGDIKEGVEQFHLGRTWKHQNNTHCTAEKFNI